MDRPGKPDLILLGDVVTADPSRPRAEAVAAAGGRVLALGARAEILALAGPGTRIVDRGGEEILPPFRDAHLHLLPLGRQAGRADLHGLDLDGLRTAVAAHAALHPGEGWVEGAGWSLDALSLGRPPDAADIAGLAGGRPVLLFSHDFHTALVSVEGMALLGMLGDRPPMVPDFDRDRDGRPTGLLREAAVFAAGGAAQAAMTEEDDREAVLAACRGLLARGIAACDDMDGGRTLRALASLRRAGRLPVRVRAAIRPADLAVFERTGLPPRADDGGLRVAGLKVFLDGALGSRTAWMLEPYEDDPGNRGLRTLEPGALEDLARRAAALGLPCFVHAIGDAAVRAALDALEAAAPGLPHRIEHAQCIHPDDLPRFRALGIAASVQPGHMATDIPVADRAWGARGARAFPLRSLLDAGAEVVFGSDAPVEPADPALWIRAAVERTTPDGRPEGGWWPAEKLDRDTALHLAILNPTRVGGEFGDFSALDPGGGPLPS